MGGSAIGGFSSERALSEDQSAALTRSFRVRFQERGEELIASGARDVEIHMALTLFYSKLIEELRIRDYDQLKEATRSVRILKEQQKTLVVWNVDTEAKAKLEARKKIHGMYSATAQKELEDIANSAASGPPLSPKLTTEDIWAQSRSTEKQPSGFPCKLCNKKFTYEWQYNTHEKFSHVHLTNLAAREMSFAVAMKRSSQLCEMVKKGVSLFTDGASASAKTDTSNAQVIASVPQARWKAAIAKTIQRITYEQYRAFVDSEEPLADHAGKSALCLYSGSKFFWRVQETVGVHLYLHLKHNCIEVISQFFTSPGVTGSQQQQTPAPELAASALLHGTRVTVFYLQYHLLLAQSLKKKNALVELDSYNRSGQGRFDRTPCTADALNEMTHSAVVEYILETLQIAGCHGLRTLEFNWHMLVASKPTESLEDSGENILSGQEFIDPNFLIKPLGLNPVKINAAKLHQMWQVQHAMDCVETSSLELAELVRRAERLAVNLEESVVAFKSNPINKKGCSNLRRVGSRMVRIIQVGKMAAKVEGLERRWASAQEQSSPKERRSPRKNTNHPNQASVPRICGF